MPRLGQMTLRRAEARLDRRRRLRNAVTVAVDPTQGIDEIIDGKTVFRLRKPMDLTVRRDGRYVLGRTEREALQAVAYHFGALWQEMAQADESRLTRDARLLKRELRSLVEHVGA